MFTAFEEVRDVIFVCTEKYGYSVDEEKLRVLKHCCDFIDTLAMEFDGKEIELGIDERTLDIIIRITLMSYFAVDSNQNDFYELLLYAKSFAFEGTEDGNHIIAEYRFPLWKKTGA